MLGSFGKKKSTQIDDQCFKFKETKTEPKETGFRVLVCRYKVRSAGLFHGRHEICHPGVEDKPVSAMRLVILHEG